MEKIYIDKLVFKIRGDLNFVKEGYLEHNTIHIQVYKSESVKMRFKIISFAVGSFETVKEHISSQISTQDVVIGNNEGYINEGEYGVIQEFYFPDYNGRNTLNITVYSSEDLFYGLNHHKFIEKMIG